MTGDPMYLQNKYTKWYFSIINNSRATFVEGYSEKHHIIPKSLGGSNSKSNIVALTPKAHYICHLLLTKMVEGREEKRKMWYASYMMTKGQKRYKPSARMYDYLRTNLIKANKDRPGPNSGKLMSDKQKIKISLAQKGKPKKPLSEETKEKMRKPKTEEHKQKLSEARRGKTFDYRHSDETKLKMSAWQKGVPKSTLVCNFCKKEISFTNHKRWHGDNCKNKPI